MNENLVELKVELNFVMNIEFLHVDLNKKLRVPKASIKDCV